MHRPALRLACLLFAFGGGSAAALAQTAMSAKTFKALGGEFSQQCSDPAALRAFIHHDGLTLRYRDKSVRGTKVLESRTHLGKNPPKDFSTALSSSVQDAGRLAFVFYTARGGLELAVDADGPVLERVGLLRISALRFRRCL